MPKQTINLQDVFLNQVRKEKIPIIVRLNNGIELKGTVKGFDSFTVVVESEGRQQLVYKHAISNICPVNAVNLIFSSEK